MGVPVRVVAALTPVGKRGMLGVAMDGWGWSGGGMRRSDGWDVRVGYLRGLCDDGKGEVLVAKCLGEVFGVE